MAKDNACQSFDIKKLCYELYKVDWMREHGITRNVATEDGIASDMLTGALKSYYEEFSAISYEFSFEDYLFEYGFKGQIFARFEEFLDNEYLEEEYICNLLDSKSLVDLYLQDVRPIPKGVVFKTLFFTREEFKTLFESVFGKYNTSVRRDNPSYNEANVGYEGKDGTKIYFSGVTDTGVYTSLSDKLNVKVKNIHSDATGVWVVYEQDDSILVKTSHGILSAVESPDPTYPGVDIELQPENLPEDYEGTLPRVLFEEVEGKLRVLVWAKSDVEDYTHIIHFE